MAYYRPTLYGQDLEDVVKQQCPSYAPARKNQPSDRWLIKSIHAGTRYLTEAGWRKYKETKLYEWQCSVVRGQPTVETLHTRPDGVVYEDMYQIVVR